jgi:hypothetical protein
MFVAKRRPVRQHLPVFYILPTRVFHKPNRALVVNSSELGSQSFSHAHSLALLVSSEMKRDRQESELLDNASRALSTFETFYPLLQLLSLDAFFPSILFNNHSYTTALELSQLIL